MFFFFTDRRGQNKAEIVRLQFVRHRYLSVTGQEFGDRGHRSGLWSWTPHTHNACLQPICLMNYSNSTIQ